MEYGEFLPRDFARVTRIVPREGRKRERERGERKGDKRRSVITPLIAMIRVRCPRYYAGRSV